MAQWNLAHFIFYYFYLSPDRPSRNGFYNLANDFTIYIVISLGIYINLDLTGTNNATWKPWFYLCNVSKESY